MMNRAMPAALALCAAALLAGCESMPTASGGGGLAAVLGGGSSPAKEEQRAASAEAAAANEALRAMAETPAQEQRALGAQMSGVLLGGARLLGSAAAQRYVNQVGAWVARQADVPLGGDGQPVALPWRFGVIDVPAANAYAAPGGYVYVTTGLLRALRSEAELAGVLAHEIAHVARGHYVAAMRREGWAPDADTAAVADMARNVYLQGLDPALEFDADRQALLYLARAGYAPAGLTSALALYAERSAAQDAQWQALLNTHPAPAERSARLNPLLAGKFAQAAGATNEARLQAVQRQLK